MSDSLVRILLLALWAAPLLLACLFPVGRLRGAMILMAPLAALPALFAVYLLPSENLLTLPWLLLGGRLGLDQTGRLFLFFTSLLYLAAGWFGRDHLAGDRRRPHFFFFFLLAMSGNCGLIAAQDFITFNFFFALMSFSAYGLVIHDRKPASLFAGRLYILLVILGESLLLAGLLLLAAAADTISLAGLRGAVEAGSFALLFAGFGIKAGLPGLHVWLPLAHPAAPVPASAVLSGAMIETGLLGWLRFLPLGEAYLPGWSVFCLVTGLFAAFYGVAVGLTQREPKIVLAYSSISQMGLMTAGIGMGLAAPVHWPEILTAVQLYAVHHGLAKGALFLGIGVAARPVARPWLMILIRAGLLLPALALAGAPFTSGIAAKTGLLKAAAHLSPPWPGVMAVLLPLSALATGLLLFRFLCLVWPGTQQGKPLTSRLLQSWLLLVLASLGSVWLLEPFRPFAVQSLGFAKAVSAGGPLLLALLLALFVQNRAPLATIRLPAGDVLVFYARAGRRLLAIAAAGLTLLEFPLPLPSLPPRVTLRRLLQQAEKAFAAWLVAGTICVLLLLLFFALQTVP